MTTTIYGRLTAVESDPIGEGLVRTWPRNPDGPEAAALLREIMHMTINAATKEGQTFGGLLTDVGRMHKRMLDAGVPET